MAALASAAQALINPSFTPRHLVEQSAVVFAGRLAAGDRADEFKLTGAAALKGQAPREHALSLAECKEDQLPQVRQVLARGASGPAIVFAGRQQDAGTAFLHLADTWLSLKPAAPDRWLVTALAPRMSATFAGGTDMLIRMCTHLLADPWAGVPVAAGVRWLEHVKAASLAAPPAGLAGVEIGSARAIHLFAASSDGDRLYRPTETDGETRFADVTAKAALTSASRRFAWLDVDRDGLADLVSWDGAAVTVRLAGADGTFRRAGEGWTYKTSGECLGLSPCGGGGTAGVLVSVYGPPVRLLAEARGWKQAPLPGGAAMKEAAGEPSACIAADLDCDGFVDVLQPAGKAGLLWRGRAEGFQPPEVAAVAAGKGPAVAAVGDFDGDGTLDILLAGAERNSLWANAGKAEFREVLAAGGSLSYKCPPGALDAAGIDLNHDGWLDLCLVYKSAEMVYHFNRGFRSFGEEGEVRLDGLAGGGGPDGPPPPDGPRPGQHALAAADFNADGSQDLAVAVTDGTVWCYLNDKADMPGLRLRLAKGQAGPVTVTCRMGDKPSSPIVAVVVGGAVPGAYVALPAAGKAAPTCHLPGEAPRKIEVVVAKATRDVPVGGGGG